MVISSFNWSLKGPGFYVDVGAHHPFRFNNTYLLYRNGWSGINIDAMPGSMTLFDRKRPRDTNLEVAISDRLQVLNYHTYKETALNTFDEAKVEEYKATIPQCPVQSVRPIRTRRLDEVLDEAVSPGQPVHLLTIDVEGLDLCVLRSNDWDRWRPQLVVAEDDDLRDLDALTQSDLVTEMGEWGYRFYAKLLDSIFFVPREFGGF